MGPLWPTTLLDVAQSRYQELCLVIRDGQLGLRLPHYLETSLGLPSYILGGFHLVVSTPLLKCPQL